MKIHELYDKEPITVGSYLSKCGVKDIEEYLHPSGKYLDNWREYEDVVYGIKEIEFWTKIDNEVTIFIIQDGDTDGICSTVILYQYLTQLSDKWNIKILIHSGKQRGLDDNDIMNRIRQERPTLVIIPDAGTNDKEQAEELCDLGIGLLVIDHHDIVTPIEKGVLINNQDMNYKVSRNGSGTLVTHKFLQGMDEYFDLRLSSNCIDLVSLSLISDSMNMTEMENREYYYYGIETIDCIVNPFLKAMFERFIGNKTYTQKDIAFSIVPKLNAICRCDDMSKKQRLMLAFIGQDNIKEVLDILEQAHKDQINIVNKVIEENTQEIQNVSKNNLIIIANDNIPRSYSGLLAGKIKTMCGDKPTIIGSIKNGYMVGSLRSPIPLRKELAENELIDFASGHEESCGIGIYENNIQALVDYYNKLEMSYEPYIDILSSYSIKSVPTKLFGLFEPYSVLWGHGIKNPMFHITNIIFTPSEWQIMGKNKRTLKLHKEGIDIVIFNCLKKDKEDLQLGYYENDVFVNTPTNKKLRMECVGELNINKWNDKKILQIIVDKFEVSCYNKTSKDDLF